MVDGEAVGYVFRHRQYGSVGSPRRSGYETHSVGHRRSANHIVAGGGNCNEE